MNRLTCCFCLLLAALVISIPGVHAQPLHDPNTPGAEPARQVPALGVPGHPGAPGDNRFGVIVTGLKGSEATEARILQLVRGVGATWWHDYGSRPKVVPGLQRAELVFTGKKWTDPSVDELRIRGPANPGACWIVGNEPNLEGQDEVDPATYAEQLHTFATRLRAVDWRARIVGANPMNWNSTCIGCNGGFFSGHAWTDAFIRAYETRFGGSPPVDVWGVHSYDLNWDRTPMVNVVPLEDDLLAMRRDLDALPAERGKPIWITEFGVVWGFDGYTVVQVGSERRIEPLGAFRSDRIAAFVEEFGNWLAVQGAPLKIERWFVYGTWGPPEPYTSASAVLSLYNGPFPETGRNEVGDAYLRLNGGVAPAWPNDAG